VSMIFLLKYFTISAANGGGFTTEWIRVAEGFQNSQLTVLVHGRISTTAGTVQLQTSWDAVTVANLGSSSNLATVGLTTHEISSGMGPMVRLNIGCTADSSATISVFLTPKSD
jgi:hypothetical protein